MRNCAFYFLVPALLLHLPCQVDAKEAGTATTATTTITLPLARHVYVIGEQFPLAVASDGKVALSLRPIVQGIGDEITVYNGPSQSLVFNSSAIAAGTYDLLVNGQATGQHLTFVRPERDSPAALIDEVVFGASDRVFDPVRSMGIDALFTMGEQRALNDRVKALDGLLETRTMHFVNPTSRPSSFIPTRVWDQELENMAMRFTHGVQCNLRYPAMGGICFEWDPGSFVRQKTIFFRFGKYQDQYDAYHEQANEVLRNDFRRRTGCEPPTQKEFLQYVLAIGKPEFAPVIDLPTRQWTDEIAQHVKRLGEAELNDLRKRVSAWHQYLMGLYGETHAFYQRALDDVDPYLTHTSSVNLDHNLANTGQYPPNAYTNLDFREMSAWNDAIGHGDYAYQWLLSGALMDANNPHGQPVWVAQATGAQHGMVGKLVRSAATNLAHHGTGIGTAAEGGAPMVYAWPKYQESDAMREDVKAAKDFLDRFAGLALATETDHGVGVLYSRTQISQQKWSEGLGTPDWQSLVTLTRLGYSPTFITEEQIREGNFKGVEALFLMQQTYALPDDVIAQIEQFVAEGGEVFADASTTIDVPGLVKLDKAIDPLKARKSYNWNSPNPKPYPRGAAQIADELHRRFAGSVNETLGDVGRGIYKPATPARSNVSLQQLDGGKDATYVIAVNDSWDSTHWSHMHWHQVTEQLVPVGAKLAARAVRYDVTAESHAGPAGEAFEVDLTTTTARVFAVVSRAIDKVDLQATQSCKTDGEMSFQVRFTETDGEPLVAVLPLHVQWVRPDGTTCFSGYRVTSRNGVFRMTLPIADNAPQGKWQLAVRSQLNGRRVTLPVTVGAGAKRHLTSPVNDRAVVRRAEAIGKFLNKPSGEIVIPVFSDQQELRSLAEKLAAALRKKGSNARVMSQPEFATYVLTYQPTDAQMAANSLIDAGEKIGRISRQTHRGEDFFSDIGGFRFGAPVILLDLVGAEDNPLAERLGEVGMLWPEVSAAFPGSGKSVVQLINDAFDPRHDAIVIQAIDVDGLKAGVEVLFDPPDDWVGTSVSKARLALMQQWGIHSTPDHADIDEQALSADGLMQASAPQPFSFKIVGQQPKPIEDVTPAPSESGYAYVKAPVRFDIRKQTYAMTRLRNTFFPNIGGPGNSDLRFTEATLLPVEVAEGGEIPIVVDGVFRYSDRHPRSQGSWENILALRDEIVPRLRKPLHFTVLLDGKEIGKLTPTETAKREVPLETLPFYSKEKPRSVTEEVVTQLSGTVSIRAGKHEVILVHQNVVDGQLDTITFGDSPEP